MYGDVMEFASKDRHTLAMLNGRWIESHKRLIPGLKTIRGIVEESLLKLVSLQSQTQSKIKLNLIVREGKQFRIILKKCKNKNNKNKAQTKS